MERKSGQGGGERGGVRRRVGPVDAYFWLLALELARLPALTAVLVLVAGGVIAVALAAALPSPRR